MEKIWYLFEDDHHKGPFSEEQIFKMFHSDQIGPEAFIWRQGLPKWLFLKDCPELWDTLSPQVPSLPEIPREASLPEGTALERTPTDEPFAQTLPELPQEKNEIPKKKIPLSWALIGGAVGALCALVLFFSSSEIPAPFFGKELSLSETERLKLIAQVRLRDGVKVGFSATGKNPVIYMASNREGPAILSLQVRSLPQRIMGTEEILATAETRMEGHYAVFSEVKFLTGTKFVPGHYSIEFVGRSVHPQREWINRFIHWGILSKEAYSEKFVYKGELLMAELPASRFQKELEAFHNKIEEETVMPYMDLKERYNTLSSFAEQLLTYYTNTLTAAGSSFDKALFERGYASELGHFFQVFVEDSEKNKNLALEKKSPIALELMELQNKSAEVGALIGEMVTKTLAKTQGKKLNQKVKRELVELFTKRIENLKSSLESKKQALDEKINTLKKTQS